MNISATIHADQVLRPYPGQGTRRLSHVIGSCVLAATVLLLLTAAPAGSIQQVIETTVERAAAVAAEVPKVPAQVRAALELTMAAIHHYG